MITSSPQIVPANRMARLLRVTVGWLKAEADAGRLPHIKAGKAYLFNPEAVSRTLAERAAQGGGA